MVVRVLLGGFTVTVPDFFRIVSGTTIPGASFIVMEVKLPRAVLGALVGVAFGVAGAVFQATLRNPLASPDVIGVSVGASAAAVAAIVGLGLDDWGVSVAAVVGALGAAGLVRFVAGDHATHRLVLAGIGVQAAMLSVIHYFFTRADEWDAQLVLRWITGSLNQADWSTIGVLLVVLALLLPVTALMARAMRVVELGDDLALSLGERPARLVGLLALATLLAAVGVAAAGPVAFVAFLSGPIARRLNGGRTTLLGAALVGAAVVVGADFAAAELLGGTNFPVGVVTGVLGAPFLLWLVATGRTRRRSA
ncbi:iron chelate uptake ABC transporter family permease subunit [Nocardioides sp. Y6]|uniref:Iron chelate uptake ABC transporter family permease subunit n=2 Tax=Nocardioides malaquae TaxID=2773426 RepID=A0ABR9RW22_9ACTN|nr:iron chelate uptake ABC transporter family permease subunit [Nocardioides malaquae]